MAQQQCPWCGHCGPRYDETTRLTGEVPPGAHDDGHPCVCRHVTAATRGGALDAGGRYYDHGVSKWLCFACGTARRIPLDDVRKR